MTAPSQKRYVTHGLYGLENRLQDSLRPLNPNPRFVSGLKQRLDKQPIPSRRMLQMPYLALGAVGLVAGVVMVVSALRALLALLARRGQPGVGDDSLRRGAIRTLQPFG